MRRWQFVTLWTSLGCYTLGRICQMFSERLPTLLIVLLHVTPAAVFALIHGAAAYRWKGIGVFAGLCLGIGALFESLSLRTGFPFGHYVFTGVMGPQAYGLPFLLVLAYFGIGYCAWWLARLILGYKKGRIQDQRHQIAGFGIFALPVFASFIMLAWDLSLEAYWADIDKAWIWRDGGAFFGVPTSNFVGWYLTAYVFYQLFALYLSRMPPGPKLESRLFRRFPILFYGVCAGGNLLILWQPSVAPIFVDASGHRWISRDILAVCVLMTAVIMAPMALLAWLRLKELEAV